MWSLVVLTFILKHGSYLTKTLISLVAGEAVSTVVMNPFVNKYVLGVDDAQPSAKELSPETVNQYLELQAMKALRDLDKQSVHPQGVHPQGIHPQGIHPQGVDPAVHEAAISHLQVLLKNHAGIFARASKEYFSSDAEAKLFFEKHGIDSQN